MKHNVKKAVDESNYELFETSQDHPSDHCGIFMMLFAGSVIFYLCQIYNLKVVKAILILKTLN